MGIEREHARVFRKEHSEQLRAMSPNEKFEFVYSELKRVFGDTREAYDAAHQHRRQAKDWRLQPYSGWRLRPTGYMFLSKYDADGYPRPELEMEYSDYRTECNHLERLHYSRRRRIKGRQV